MYFAKRESLNLNLIYGIDGLYYKYYERPTSLPVMSFSWD